MTSYVGVDFGSRHVRAVAGTKKGPVFVIERVVQIEVPGADDVESATLGAVSDLRAALGKSAAKLGGGRFGLSGRELMIRYTHVPPVPLWRLKILMDFELREMAAQAGDKLACDYNLLNLPNAGADDETVLFAVCKESFLDGRFDAMKTAVAEPKSGLPASVALFNAFVACGDIKDDEYTFLVDVGDRNVELVLTRNGELLFARNIATGGRALTDAIAGAFGRTTADAEDLKHRFGNVTPRGLASGASGDEEKVGNAIIGPVGQLAAMIQSSLAFTRAQTKIRDLEIGRVMLSGGGANLRGLPEYLASALKCKVERFQPENGLDTSGLPADEAALFQSDPGSFAVALGLARTSGDSGAFKLDLVPEPAQKKRVFQQRTLFMILAAVVAAGFLGYHAFALKTQAAKLEGEARQARQAADKSKAQRKDYESEQVRIDGLNTKMAAIAAYTEPAFVQNMVQGFVQKATPEMIWVEQITTRRESRAKNAADPKSGRELKTVTSLVGLATPQEGNPGSAITALSQGLKNAWKGSTVEIKKQQPGGRGGSMEFTFEILPPGKAP